MPSVRFCPLNRDPLHLVERDLVARAVIELGRARTFVRGHGLGVLQRAAGFQIGGDSLARKVWQPMLAGVPRSAARRWIMRQASFIGLSVSVPVRPAAERKRGALPSSRMLAASSGPTLIFLSLV
jgi:hypothetical protein